MQQVVFIFFELPNRFGLVVQNLKVGYSVFRVDSNQIPTLVDNNILLFCQLIEDVCVFVNSKDLSQRGVVYQSRFVANLVLKG